MEGKVDDDEIRNITRHKKRAFAYMHTSNVLRFSFCYLVLSSSCDNASAHLTRALTR